MNATPALLGLLISACTLAAGQFETRVDSARGELEIVRGTQRVLVYAFATNQIKPFVRALYAPNGVNVLRDAPADHLHHHGLMYAIRVNGVNFWEETGQPGHQIGVKLTPWSGEASGSRSATAGFSHVIHWVADNDAKARDTASRSFLIETRTIDVSTMQSEVALQWRSDFVVGPVSPTNRLHGSGYNGLGLRLPEQFNLVAQRVNSEGTAYGPDTKWDVMPGRWAAVSGKTEGKEATVALFASPRNKGESRFFSMLNPFAYLAATQNLEKQPVDCRPGDKFSIRYLVVVYPNTKSAAEIEARYNRWLRETAQILSLKP